MVTASDGPGPLPRWDTARPEFDSRREPMSTQKPRPTTRAAVTLDLRVPRGEPGDLLDGVRALVERIDDVSDVEVREVEGVRPSPLDIYVTARVTLAMTPVHEDAAGVRQTLADGFGVLDVDAVALRAGEDR